MPNSCFARQHSRKSISRFNAPAVRSQETVNFENLKTIHTRMAVQSAMLLLIAVVVGTVAAQTQSPYPILNITKGQPLPVLPEIQPDASGWVTLNMLPATIAVSCCLYSLLITFF